MAKKYAKPRPTKKMKRLYDRLVDHWGQPTDLFVFDAREIKHPVCLPLLFVPTWVADKQCDVTAFNTLGMSNLRMKRATYFTELHFAYRGSLSERRRLSVARKLADVAEYPFENGLKLDWWHIIPKAGAIPAFPGCRHLLLHPKFKNEGFDTIDDEDGLVKVLYVVPITPRERHIIIAHGRNAFWDYVEDERIDILTDRHDEPKWYEAWEQEQTG
jgi:hypothetical protein